MSPLQSVLRRLGVEPAETTIFAWAGFSLSLLGAAAFALLNTAETLFLKRVGVEYLPWALLASSALLVVTTALVGRAIAGADRAIWLPRVLLLLGLALLPFAVLMGSEVEGVFWALVLVARQLLALGLLVFWMALGDLVTGRQAKRLFGPLASGITVGGIVGSFGSDPIARVVGIDGVPVVCALLLVGASLAARRLRRARPPSLERGVRGARVRGRAADPDGLSARRLWRDSQLFRLLVVALLAGGALSPVLYFQFSFVADAATSGADGEQQLLALYSQFRGWLNVVMLGAQLWLSSRLYRRIGLPRTLMLWPATYLFGFIWLGVSLGLPAGIATLGSARVAEDGIAAAALRVLFTLFPESVRSRASGLLEGPINRLGGVLGNGLVLLALALATASAVAYLAIPIAALWLFSALALWRAYPSLLLQASADRTLVGAGADRATLLDASTLRALVPSLADPEPARCRAALDLIGDAEPSLVLEGLAEAVEKAPETTRPMLVAALHRLVEPRPPGGLRSAVASATLGRVLASPSDLPPEERADLLQVYARLTGGEGASEEVDRDSLEILQRALGDREAAVRLASIAELHRRGRPPPGVADLDSVLRGALAGRDVLMRRTARREVRAMLLSMQPRANGANSSEPSGVGGDVEIDQWETRLELLTARLDQRADRAETVEALVEVARRHDGAVLCREEAVRRWVEDRDPRVRAGVLRFLGFAGAVDVAPALVTALGSRDEGESTAARDALVALGPAAAEALLVARGFGAPRARDAALAVLQELETDPAELDALYRRALASLQQALRLRVALGSDHPEPLAARPLAARNLAVRRLEERVSEGLGAVLALLAITLDDERIAELERRLRRTRDQRRRDILIEALESLLGAPQRAEIVPILEATLRYEAADGGEATLSAEQAWRELRNDPDELTRRLARAADGPTEGSPHASPVEEASAIEDASEVPDPMDIAVRLQETPAFDRLTTQQLMRLAEVVKEKRIAAGESVFREGDEGSGLYFVLEGEAEVSTGGVELERVGPGGFFGELAALDGVERSVSVQARAALRLLRLDRQDLLGLMEDAPELAIGLSQFLSERVRTLQQRLRGAAS